MTEGPKQGSLEERLSAVRKQMEDGLPRRAAELREAADRLSNGAPSARDEIRRFAHKIRGTVGSHGLAALGEEAGHVEALASGPGGTDELVAATRSLIASIGRAARAAYELAPRSQNVAPSASSALAALPSLAGLRLLAIDDDASTRKLLALTLGSMGRSEAQVLEAPEAALALLEREPFDLVVVDAMMPSITGLAFAHAVRSRERGAPVPIAFLSAASREELGWELPVRTTWLRKPFRPRELLESLVSWLGERDDGAR